MTPVSFIYSQETVSPRWRGLMSGATTMGSGLGQSGAALAGGYLIVSQGYRSLFLTSVILTTVAALLLFGYLRWNLRHVVLKD